MGDLLINAEAIPSEEVRQSGLTEVSRSHSTVEVEENSTEGRAEFSRGVIHSESTKSRRGKKNSRAEK